MITLSHRYQGIVFNNFEDLVNLISRDEEMRLGLLREILTKPDLREKLPKRGQKVSPELAKEYLEDLGISFTAKELTGNLLMRRVQNGDKIILFEDYFTRDYPSDYETQLSKRYGRELAYIGSNLIISTDDVPKFLTTPNLSSDISTWISEIAYSKREFIMPLEFETQFSDTSIRVILCANRERMTMAITPKINERFFVYDDKANEATKNYAEHLCSSVNQPSL